MKKILVANRGEIAVRVIRTVRELGYQSVAVYAEPDIHTLACDLADEAYSLGGHTAADTYLNPAAILQAARRSHADAIHPGYGFLAEDADFAQAVIDANLTWIGPSPQTIRQLGDKIQARQLAESIGVHTIPGISDAISDPEAVSEFATQYGYPLLIKRADAGGGRGITRIDNAADLIRFFTEQLDATQTSPYFVEKLVEHARHVETQCVRDSHGTFSVVSTRDCSVQRRNQKVVEEAPAPGLSDQLQDLLYQWSNDLFAAAHYVGVGTCEFLVSADGQAYFLEVNPRLQVEHTVSEEITGIDLVAEQLRIAYGQSASPIPQPRGHAIEVRVTSEDPANDLMPALGRIHATTWPGGLGVRVDTFIRPEDEIGGGFDSLIAKITVRAADRDSARARLQRALEELSILGLPTSAPLLRHIIAHPDFAGLGRSDAGNSVYTKWLEDKDILGEFAQMLAAQNGDTSSGIAPVAAAGSSSHPSTNASAPSAPTAAGMPSGSPANSASATPSREHATVSQANNRAARSYVIEVDGRRMRLSLPPDLTLMPHVGNEFSPSAALHATTINAASSANATSYRPLQRLKNRRVTTTESDEQRAGEITAPIPATVVRLAAQAGQDVIEGELLIVLEAMKMEKYLYAPCSGTLDELHVSVGDSVMTGQILGHISPTESQEDSQ
ncbi:biotin carboxylase N-terminal domain-containing protein [Trueperella sp. LYQ141]|uniref:ATP-binding protein n=1 Tax=Trueperella sp. LYQ141 TaxID=3391058 RepID=UPI003982F994